MTIGTTALAVIVTLAVAATALSPFILLAFWINDRRKGRLW